MRLHSIPLAAAIVLSASVAGLTILTPTAAQAQSTIYTDTASFASHLQTSYTETFTGSPGISDSASFSGNGFGYTMTASAGANGIFRDGNIIGTENDNNILTITFTTGNVTAIGGNFYNTDRNGAFQQAPVVLTLSDGTGLMFTPDSESTFRGFISSVPITSLTYASPGPLLYSNVDNLTVGAAAPEPASLALIAGTVGLPVMGQILRRRRKSA